MFGALQTFGDLRPLSVRSLKKSALHGFSVQGVFVQIFLFLT